jgi:hypothetical protein
MEKFLDALNTILMLLEDNGLRLGDNFAFSMTVNALTIKFLNTIFTVFVGLFPFFLLFILLALELLLYLIFEIFGDSRLMASIYILTSKLKLAGVPV